MGYISLYRKYRPTTFDELVGQAPISTTLRNEVKANRISNAYLFCGPRGTGKTSAARIFAKAMNCSNPVNGNPCNKCETCTNQNIDIQEIDAASNNSVDSIRQLVNESGYVCQFGKRRVYIIDEVHMLTGASFNALLKTLEEPPPDTTFILATTEKYKVPSTIMSRCQSFDFKPISDTIMIAKLAEICKLEGITCKYGKELQLICKLSNGALRDALSILDQCAMMCDNVLDVEYMKDLLGQVPEETCNHVAELIDKGDIPALIDIIDKLCSQGKQMHIFADEMYKHYRDIAMSSNESTEKNFRMMSIFSELASSARQGMSKVLTEIAVIKACRPQMQRDYDSLVHRIEMLESMQCGNITPIDSKPQISTITMLGCNGYKTPITAVI